MNIYELEDFIYKDSTYDIDYVKIGDGRLFYFKKDGIPSLVVEVPEGHSMPPKVFCFREYLCIGWGNYIYFVNQKNLQYVVKEVEGYFDDYKVHKDILVISGMESVTIYDLDLNIMFSRRNLADDGVIIHDVTDEYIDVLCIFDPPEGPTVEKRIQYVRKVEP